MRAREDLAPKSVNGTIMYPRRAKAVYHWILKIRFSREVMAGETWRYRFVRGRGRAPRERPQGLGPRCSASSAHPH